MRRSRSRRRNPAPKTTKEAYDEGYEVGYDKTGMRGHYDPWPSEAELNKPDALVRAWMRGVREGEGQKYDENERQSAHRYFNPRRSKTRRRNPSSGKFRLVLADGTIKGPFESAKEAGREADRITASRKSALPIDYQRYSPDQGWYTMITRENPRRDRRSRH